MASGFIAKSIASRNICGGLVALTMSAASAFAQPAPAPAPKPPGELESKLDQVVKEYARDPQFKGYTEQQVRDRIEFVAGNVIFATVHEVGHMLVSEMGIPVLGKEEDAVDAFAVLTGLKLGGALSDRILTQSARGWFLSDRRNQKQKIKMIFYDEHGLDRQRAYNIVCLMVGGSPEKFGKVAELTKMPEERQATCQGDFSNASWSWNKVLEPHIRKPDQPKVDIPVVYTPTKKYAVYEKGFREIRLLEVLAEHLSDRFAWPKPVSMVMEECDDPGARWDMSDRKIHVCYELAADFGEMYRDYGGEQKKTQKTAGKKHKR